METFEVEINKKKYTLKEPTAGLETELQDKTMEMYVDEDTPKMRFKVGFGQMKILKLISYIAKIEEDAEITEEKIKNLPLETFNKLLDELDKRGGVKSFRKRSDS